MGVRCSILLLCAVSAMSQALPPRVAEVLGWLPADTETIFVTNKPFAMSGPDTINSRDRKPDGKELFQWVPVNLFRMSKAAAGGFFAGQRIQLAVEGSRNFRPPSGLGVVRYEGCEIAVLAEARTDRKEAYFRRAADSILRVDEVAGHQVAVFEEKAEDDLWTFFVAFPKPDLALLCTHEGYLREVIGRINGTPGLRALPANLPEWAHVDTRASSWALRHYDRGSKEEDPTSPFQTGNTLGMVDPQAVGVTMSFDGGKKAKLSYLSGTADVMAYVEHNTPLPLEAFMRGSGIPVQKNLPVRFRQAAPGVAEIQYELGDKVPLQVFLFVAVAVFGHAVYL